MAQLLTRDVVVPVYVSTQKLIKYLAILVLCLTVAGAISSTVWLLNYPFPGAKWFHELFDLDGEFNIPSWYSAFSLLFCAGLLAVITTLKQGDRYFSDWKLLAVIFLFLSLDEIFSFHELLIIPSLRKSLHLNPIFRQTWVIPGIILVAFLARKYFKFLLHLPQRTRYLFFLAAVVYIGGALGMEMMGGLLRDLYGRRSIMAEAAVVLEEFLEMAGVLLFASALLAYIRTLTENVHLKIHLLER